MESPSSKYDVSDAIAHFGTVSITKENKTYQITSYYKSINHIDLFLFFITYS